MGRPRSDIRPRVLSAARARFLIDGVDGASLRAIAKDAGTNIGMVYYYFETKDALFLDVVEEHYVTLLSDLEKIFEDRSPFLARVERASARIGALSPEELEVVRIVMGEMLGGSQDRKALLLARFAKGHLGLVTKAAMEAVASGEVANRNPLPTTMLATFGAAILPQVIRQVLGDLPLAGLPLPLPEGEPLAAGLVDILRHGVGPKEAD